MNPESNRTAPVTSNDGRARAQNRAAVITLILVTLLTFANAAPDNLVFDDTAFIGPKPFFQLETLGEAFTRDLWRHENFDRGLYRPLLQIDFELENRLFGDWLRGYHLVNILLHLAATLLVFGFLRYLLLRDGRTDERSTLYALLAALVFAVHPAHTEVVASVFNRSAILVTICAIGGLWWLLRHVETNPARAWIGLGLIYSVAILFKESALVIPGIAVAVIVFWTGGGWLERVRRFLPVFWLLIPIIVYFLLRAHALAPDAGAEAGPDVPEIASMFEATRLAGGASRTAALALFGEGLKVLAWPHPLKLFYERPPEVLQATYLAIQAVLLVWALWLLRRGRPALITALAFYYLALLPSTRLLSMGGSAPHIAERYLYFPSAGLAIALAFAFGSLVRRFGSRLVTGVTLPVLVLLAVVTWERNADWASEILLFEKEYQRGQRNRSILRVLPAALIKNGQHARVAQICDENAHNIEEAPFMVDNCVVAYSRMRRIDDAVEMLKEAMQLDYTWASARITLASIYIARRQYQEAADLYVEIINRAEDPATKEFYKGELLYKLYPNRREALEQARAHFEEARRLDPEQKTPGERLEDVERKLQELAEPAATPAPGETGVE